MKVYVVVNDYYGVAMRVFSTREKALNYIAQRSNPSRYYVDDFEVDAND